MTAAYVQTRGRPRHRDYDFLGAGPGEPWWRAYAGHTAFESPTVLVESSGTEYRVYLSGIPSARRDSVGTVIRYTLVLEETPDDPDGAGPDGVLALVSCWVAGGTTLTAALDEAFPEDDVERLLAATAPETDPHKRVLAAVRSLPPYRVSPVESPGDWLGSAESEPARTAFLGRVQDLVAGGAAGRALLLNLIGGPDDLADLLTDPSPLVVLAPELGFTEPTPLPRPASVGKALPSAAIARLPGPRTVAPMALLLALGVAVLLPLGVILLSVLLLMR